MHELLDVVALAHDLPGKGLRAGDLVSTTVSLTRNLEVDVEE
jgi:hypothetical protein